MQRLEVSCVVRRVCTSLCIKRLKQKTRFIDDETIMNLETLLKEKEKVEAVYTDTNTSPMFNSFVCTFLNIF